jgi:mannose-6-phosphate isomerase-like protein (cupin superfamily)
MRKDNEMATYSKSFQKADETRQFKGHGHVDVLQFDDRGTIGRGVFEPGWKWSNDVKPIAGTPSCQSVHTGYCVSGRMTIRMDNGDEFTVGPGDAFHMPAGHDAWTVGNEPCVLIDTTGVKAYAKPK